MPNVKSKAISSHLSDFSINDYANAAVARSQRKKSARPMTPSKDDLNWDDNIDDDIDLVEQEDEDGTTIIVAQKVSRNSPFTNIAINYTNSEGNSYPLDIWFLISKFIAPEDVGRFASICRATFEVTRSAEFWFHLYKRYYKPHDSMPSRLRPDEMKIRYGLRSCVIRSLYYTYPFTKTQSNNHDFHNFYTPKDLLKRKCLSLWYEKSKGMWIFYFKLKLIERSIYFSRSTENFRKNIYEMLDDIMANNELNCKILKVHCKSFSDAPPVMGTVLCTLYTKVAPNMQHNRLHLGFSQSVRDEKSPSDFTVILNNVVKMEVLNWWNTDYPHSMGLLPYSIIQNSSNSMNELLS